MMNRTGTVALAAALALTAGVGARAASWFDPGWGYRLKVVADAARVPAGQTDVPVLLDLSRIGAGHGFWSHVKQGGGDLVVTASDGTTRLPLEVVSCDTVAKTGEVWFKGDLNASSDTEFYAYYGNATANQPAPGDTYGSQNVWTNGYAGVWHLHETSGTHVDSTANPNDAAPLGGTVQDAAGKIDGADEFNLDLGHDDMLSVPHHASLMITDTLTLEAWVRPASFDEIDQRAIHKRQGTSKSAYGLFVDSDASVEFRVADAADVTVMINAGALTMDQWSYMVGTFNDAADTAKVYVDGAHLGLDTSFTGTINPGNTEVVNIGGHEARGARGLRGRIDEVRISNVVRDWGHVKTQYNMQGDQGTFWKTVSPEEQRAPVITSTPPAETYVGSLYSYTVTATGHPAPTFNVSGLPGWLDFDGTDTISGTPGPADAGVTGTITVTATNGVQPDDTQEFDITVIVPWVDRDWGYRLKVVVDAAKVPSGQTGVPILLDLSRIDQAHDFWSRVKADGGDLVIAAADGDTRLPLEVVSLDTTGKTGEVWFKGDLSASSDTEFYVYYGNASASQPAPGDAYGSQAVWTSGYAGVWHLNQDPSGGAGAVKDSSPSPIDGTAYSMTSANLVDGKLGKALDFSGDPKPNADYVRFPSDGTDKLSISGDYITLEAWVRRNCGTDYWMGVVARQVGTGSADSYNLTLTNNANDKFTLCAGENHTSSAGAVPDLTWTHLVGVRDGSQIRLYADGVNVGTKTGVTTSISTDVNDTTLGAQENDAGSDPSEQFMGRIDEARISNVARSADYVQTQYNMQGDQGTFWKTVASEEERPPLGTVLQVVGNPSSMTAGDTAVKNRLESLQYAVEVVDDAQSAASDADGKALVYICESVISGQVNVKFRDVTVPVVCSEALLLDDMKMAGAYGYQDDQLHVKIVDDRHALAAGLSGAVTVYTGTGQHNWGEPSEYVTKVATVPGDPGKAVLFGYEPGARMIDNLIAPARRVGLFPPDANNEAAMLTAAGQALLDAAVRWADGRTPEVTAQPADRIVIEGLTATFTVGSSGTAPVSYQWYENGVLIEGATNSSYTTPAVTSDDDGDAFRCRVTDAYGVVTSADAALTVADQAPYWGVPSAIPGTIQAEDYDHGGEGVAYHDTTSGNSGGKYRSEDVDIENCADVGGGYNTGWAAPGEWMEYSVEVASDSSYDINVRVASKYTDKYLHIEIDGTDVTGQIDVPSGGWQDWHTVTVSSVWLTAGQKMMRVVTDTNAVNFNYVTFVDVGPLAPTIVTQPSDQTVAEGETATFTVEATGTEPLSYQWFRGTAAIAGATSASYTTPLAIRADSGQEFTCELMNAYGSATSDAATLTVTGHVGEGDGLSAVYYDNMDFTGTTVERIDATVDFDWGSGSPDPSIGPDTFSAVWTGTVVPYYSERITFYTVSDDGVRLWVGGRLLIDSWKDQSATERSASIALIGGEKYPIRMEYYENTGLAVAQLSWSSDSTAKEVIPQSQLYSEWTAPVLAITTPDASATSPAWVEGDVESGVASVWVTVGTQDPFEAVRENPTRWFADDPAAAGPLGIPLAADAATDIVVTSKDANGGVLGTVNQSVSWAMTDLAGRSPISDSVTIRKGDKLLLTAASDGSADLFFDDFSGGAASWTPLTGTWSVSNQQYHQTETGDNRWSLAGEATWTDFSVEARVKLEAQTNNGAGLLFRVVDQDNLYMFAINDVSKKATIWRQKDGAFTPLVFDADPPLPTGTWYLLRVDVRGSQIDAYIDGEFALSTTDPYHAAGKIGLDCSSETWFDDVRVSPLLEIDASGTGTFVQVPGGAGKPLEAAYDTAGIFTPAARIDLNGDGDFDDEGEDVGLMTVIAIEFPITKPIGCMMYHVREKDVPVNPVGALDRPPQLVFVPEDLALMEAWVAERTATGVTLHMYPVVTGTSWLQARIGDRDGPVALRHEVHAFVLTYMTQSESPVFERYADGDMLVGNAMHMDPNYAGHGIRLWIYGGGALFEETGTAEHILETTAEAEGEYLYYLVTPGGFGHAHEVADEE